MLHSIQKLLSLLLALVLPAAIAQSAEEPRSRDFTYSTFPAQPEGMPWPTQEWQRAALPVEVDRQGFQQTADLFFAPPGSSSPGRTLAVLVTHGGNIVYERYAPDISCRQTLHTMSIAKMLGAVMAGLLVRDGKLDIDAPLDFPEWADSDPRGDITTRHLLTMTSGLRWRDPADFLEFAFGSSSRDLAGFVASQPLEHAPGSYFQYSDGTPSLIGALLRRETGGTRERAARYLRERLFEPLGMTRTQAEFDQKGTWYGSSGARWSPCDLARFGHFLLRDGTWEGRQLLPAGWVNFMRTPSEASLSAPLPAGLPEEARLPYGAFTFVLDLPISALPTPDGRRVALDAFGHEGFGGSLLRIVPSRDAVLLVIAEGVHDDAARFDRARALTDSLPNWRKP